MKKFLVVFLTMASLTACSSTQGTKGIGAGTDSYKESPCACLLIEQPNLG